MNSEVLTFFLEAAFFCAVFFILVTWSLRSANVHHMFKVVLGAGTVALGIWMPFSVNALLGKPVYTKQSHMPKVVQLLADVPSEDEKTVHLWVVEPETETPRAYSIAMTQDLKRELRKANKRLGEGHPVFLEQGAEKENQVPGEAGDVNQENLRSAESQTPDGAFSDNQTAFKVTTKYDIKPKASDE